MVSQQTEDASVRESSSPAQPPSTRAVTIPGVAANHDRFAVLDGWRGISILSVLACHLLPLGPKNWHLNTTAGLFGMAVFFTLSGFLITSNLLQRPEARAFLIRRASRILPLAYLYVMFALVIQGKGLGYYLAYFLFGINYETQYITEITSPLWSLCVEVHFYAFVGLLVAIGGRRLLFVLPFLAILVTANRAWHSVPFSIHTHLRVDEILVGATVALIHADSRMARIRECLALVHPTALIVVLLICCHPASGPLAYLRPYAGAAMVACTLWRGRCLAGALESRTLKYFADISYALYVIHPINRYGWLATGGTFERYLIKRPVGLAITFILAHLSTFRYERWWIERGKAWSKRPVIVAFAPRPESVIPPATVE